MKQLNQSISREYLPLDLYRDDLESIERILNESSAEVEINADGFQFDSVDELTAHFNNRRVRSVEIRARSPYVTIELKPMWAKLYAGSSEIPSAGLFYKLDRLLTRAQRRLSPLYSYYFVSLLNIGMWLSFLLRGVAATSFMVFVCTAWILWMCYVRGYRHSIIVLARRGSASFWARKKDELLLIIVSALLGAILGVGGTLLVGYLK